MDEQRERLMLRGLLHEAGVTGDIEWLSNPYWPAHPDYDAVRTPWLRVATPRGYIEIGWRKRVIALSWDASFCVHGRDVVGDDKSVTHGENMCHAWGWEEAAAALRRLCATAKREAP